MFICSAREGAAGAKGDGCIRCMQLKRFMRIKFRLFSKFIEAEAARGLKRARAPRVDRRMRRGIKPAQCNTRCDPNCRQTSIRISIAWSVHCSNGCPSLPFWFGAYTISHTTDCQRKSRDRTTAAPRCRWLPASNPPAQLTASGCGHERDIGGTRCCCCIASAGGTAPGCVHAHIGDSPAVAAR